MLIWHCLRVIASCLYANIAGEVSTHVIGGFTEETERKDEPLLEGRGSIFRLLCMSAFSIFSLFLSLQESKL